MKRAVFRQPKTPLRNRRSSGRRSTINRVPSPFRLKFMPPITVIIASMVTALPIITDYPILPPMGLLMLLAWRLIRPGLWPVWVGFPFGLFDDIFSGQPMGSAALLWSLIFIGLEYLDRKSQVRDYWQDWFVASLSVIFVTVMAMLINYFPANLLRLEILLPQILLSVLLYPFVARLVGAIDNWRLYR